MFGKMASGYCESDSEDELLNLHLFTRKSFGFTGFSAEKENTLKSIVKQIGAACDDFPKYIFTSADYFNSLTESNSPLYNVTFIRDCVDANRYLNIEQYRFRPKCIEKKNYRDFEPCCGDFHNGQEACIVCDPNFKSQVPVIQQKKKTKFKLKESIEVKSTITNKKSQSKTANGQVNSNTDSNGSKKKNFWEPWECRLLLDYIICNKLFLWVKSPSLYKRIVSEGFLTHRTPESMRVYFCKKILNDIETYDLPKPIMRKLKRIRKVEYPIRNLSTKVKSKMKKPFQNEKLKQKLNKKNL